MSTAIDLMGRRVLIVGDIDQLSQALAMGFREEGAEVLTLASLGSAPSRNVESVKSDVKKSIQELGGLDTFVVHLGLTRGARITEATDESWETAFTAPSKAAFFATQAALTALKSSRGSIVNITSVLALMGAPTGLAIPAAAMACFVHHTRMMALRLSTHGVRANAVCHGYLSPLESLGCAAEPEKTSDQTAAAGIPLGRWTTPGDVTGTVLFLASQLAANITGAVIVNDGGTYSGH